MQIQNSFKETEDPNQKIGRLYLVGTPIGNLEDITYRAVRLLQEVDWIAAEDTRQTGKLLRHFGISSHLNSYHEHNKRKSGQHLIGKMQQGGTVALVSDAGLPAISDPGSDLVQLAIEHDIPVIPIPGANAALTALIASGLSTERFQFIGFLPRQNKKREEAMQQLKGYTGTLLVYESPHRMESTLTSMSKVWGNRYITLARELTKKYEEIVRGQLNDCLERVMEAGAKGEYCIIIEGASNEEALVEEGAPWWAELSVEEHVRHYLGQNHGRMEAMKMAAADRKISKRIIYNQLIPGEKE